MELIHQEEIYTWTSPEGEIAEQDWPTDSPVDGAREHVSAIKQRKSFKWL